MIVCLNCHRVSPAGSLFCPSCAMGLGYTYCEKFHRNPLGGSVQACATCRSVNLTEGTRCLRLGWLPKTLAALVALALWKWAVARPGFVASTLWRATLSMAAFLLDSCPACVSFWLRRTLVWLVLAWAFGLALGLLPGRGGAFGAALRNLPLTVARSAARTLPGLLRAAFAAARHFFFDRPARGRALPKDGGTE